MLAMGRNVFNHVSYAPPVGVLESGRFGQYTSTAGGFFGSSASNRSIELQGDVQLLRNQGLEELAADVRAN